MFLYCPGCAIEGPFGWAPRVTLRVRRSASLVDESLGELVQVVHYRVWLGGRGFPYPLAGRRTRADTGERDFPGAIDTGAWDSMGEDGKRDYFKHISDSNPARRIGTPEDVAGGVLFAMTNTFMTGMTLKTDGGEPLV